MNCSGMISELARAGDPKAISSPATMPANARTAATTVATIQPVGLLSGWCLGWIVGGHDVDLPFVAARTFRSALTPTLREYALPRDRANGGWSG